MLAAGVSSTQAFAALIIACTSLISAIAAGAVGVINALHGTRTRAAIATDLHTVARAVPDVNTNDLITDTQGNIKG